ncbi:MAG: nicotinate phosphoribosyltransferase [Alkalispirochaetaceae bacterium]
MIPRYHATSGLLTDLYELTMMQGYYQYKMNECAVFDMFFRRQPFDGGFSIFAGLEDLVETLENLSFEEEEIEYLRSTGYFNEEFLGFLRKFRFQGELWSVSEGSVVFPGEPLIRVHATLMEAQLIESLLLNIINYQTLVATKTARVYLASNEGKILEFGLRRAQGWNGALQASRAAYVGGASATSNTLAGKLFGIPVSGTMAHSWVMAFGDEEESFRRYADLYPTSTILLIDTFETLGSGLRHAIAIGKELQRKGHQFGVRLDSGDIQYLSKEVRKALDAEGLSDAKIAVSNELNEEIIHQLVTANSPIDLWGVGTQLVTGGDESSLAGVYKLAAIFRNGSCEPTMKISDNPEKSTNPGIKQLHRFYDKNGQPVADLVSLEEEEIVEGGSYTFYHPAIDYRHFRIENARNIEPLIHRVMKEGKRCRELPALQEIQDRTKSQLSSLDETYKRIINPHIYKVSISSKLKGLKQDILQRVFEEEE